MSGPHRLVPISRELHAKPTILRWRCAWCDDRWVEPPEPGDPCPANAANQKGAA